MNNTTPRAVTALLDHIKSLDVSVHKFAVTNGLDPATLSKLVNGKQGISLALAFKLEDITGGAVGARLWLEAS